MSITFSMIHLLSLRELGQVFSSCEIAGLFQILHLLSKAGVGLQESGYLG